MKLTTSPLRNLVLSQSYLFHGLALTQCARYIIMELSPLKKKTTSQRESIFKEYDPTIFVKKTRILKASGMTQVQIQINDWISIRPTTSKRDGASNSRHPKRMVRQTQ